MAKDIKVVFLRLPPELVGQIDERADHAGLSRNAWAQRALSWAIVHPPAKAVEKSA